MLPSKDTITQTIIPKLVERTKDLIKEEIKSSKGICGTLDSWSTKYTNIQFLSFTIHFFDGKEIKSRVLRLSNDFESHKSIHIKDFILSVIDEYNLTPFVPFPLITDNAPDVLHAVNLAGLISVGCACHRLELIIQEVLDQCDLYKTLVNKCQHIAVKFRQS